MKMIKLLAVGLTATMLGACASITAIPVEPGEKISGIPIYGSVPILLVQPSGTSIVMVPNRNERYALRFNAFLAENTSDVTLKNMMVDGKIDAKLDSTGAIELVQELAKPIIDAATAQFFSDQAEKVAAGQVTIEHFAVFGFDFNDDGTLIGMRRLDVGGNLKNINVAQKLGSDL